LTSPVRIAQGLIGALIAAGFAAGCGGSGAAHRSATSAQAASICATGLPALAEGAKVPRSKVAVRVTRTSDHMPQCDFRAGALSATVSVDTSPQPYQVLERQIDEESQMFTPTRTQPAPRAVRHLGLDAAWFPEEQYVMTTDGKRLITVTVVRWPGHRSHQRVALATAVARPYLGRLVGRKSARGEV
jgi:hypothetical protein